MKRKTILMAVYNPIEVDGRVKRACEALAAENDLTLICVQGNGHYRNALFAIQRIRLPSLGRIGKLFWFWLNVVVRAWLRRPDIVYAHDFFLPLPGYVAAKGAGSKWVYDSHELMVPTPSERLGFNARLFYLLEKLVVRRADLVIAANSERAAIMREHYRLPVTPTVVGNVPQRSAAVFDGDEVFRRFPSLRKAAPGDVYVVYMGDIDFDRGLGVFVESAALLPPRFKLVFVGGGPHLGRVEELARKESGRFIVVGQVPHAHVHDVIRCADIGYVTYKMVGMNNLLCAPNKIFEYAHAGLPILATCQHTVRRIFSEHRIGRLVGCDGVVTPQEIATALQELAAKLADYRRELEPFLSHYSWHAESSRLARAVGELGPPAHA